MPPTVKDDDEKKDSNVDAAAATTVVEEGPDLNSSRSPFDKKSYRQILLPNGLRAVLVSDAVAMTQAYNSGGLYPESGDDDDDDEEQDGDDDDEEEEETLEDHDDDDDDNSTADDDRGGGLRNAAAAMLVGVGSLYDPVECQGMAHFLEHLLFMGSKKYPDENAYDAFMSKHGGNDNAYTEMEHTVYHFEIPQEHLKAALDIFAQFFVAPLMLESSVERELQAIESEFQLVKNSDNTRVQQLMCHTCGRTPTEHPVAKFGWGNYRSLKEIPENQGHRPLEMLREFYDKYYFASNMRLVVMGAYTLDYLQEHVVKSFSDVRADSPLGSYTWKDTYDSPMKKLDLPFADHSLQKIFYIAPVKDRHSLSVTWQIPPQIDHWRSKPCDYIAHLIGHEGTGSLLASLKAKSWVTACCAGVGEDGDENTTAYALFIVSFTLSEEGVAHWKEVVTELYQYVGMLRFYCQSKEGLPKWIFDELKSIYEVAHRFADEQPPEDYAVELAEECSPWWNISPERLLDASGLLFEYDPKTIQALIDNYFTPRNARIDFASTLFGRSAEYEEDTSKTDYSAFFDPAKDCLEAGDAVFDPKKAGAPHVEPIFGTPFWCQAVTPEQLDDWEKVAWPQMPSFASMLALPQPNQFIPTNFDMKPLPASDSDHPLLNCSIKLQISVGKRKQWFPATVTQYNQLENQILCAFEDEDEKWHSLDVPSSELQLSRLTSPGFEGTLDGKKIKYRIVSLALEGSKAVLKFGDESDFEVDCGKVFPAVPPATPPSRLPKQVWNTNELKLWHLQDRTFKRPIADLRLQLNCVEANKTSLHTACSDILVNLVSDAVTEIAYMASVCELGSSFSSNDTGFSLRVHGFDDKLLDLFLVMLDMLLRFRNHNSNEKALPDGFSVERFELILETYRRSCVNSGMKSSKLGSAIRIQCLRPGNFSARQKFLAVEKLDISTFTSTVASIMSQIGGESLYHGNVDLNDANFAKEKILELLRNSAPSWSNGNAGLARKKYPSQFVLQLPPKQLDIVCAAKDPAESNTAVELYVQVGKDNLVDRVMVDLLMEILYEPIYNQLRTNDQFGYDVSCASRWTHGIIGMVFCVVTPIKTAEETKDRIEKFLLDYRQKVADMSNDDFMEIMIGLANDKLNMFNSLSEETGHYWSEIREGRYSWEDHREEVLHLKKITKEETLKAYDKWLSPKNKKRRQMTIKVVAGEGPAAVGRPEVTLEDIEDYNDRSVEDIHKQCKQQTFGRVY